MNDQDRQRFAAAINGMAATFRQEPTRALLHGYWLGLQDLEIEAVERAVVTGIRNNKFMPTAAELRELAGDMRGGDRAVLAWTAFEKAVTQHGGYMSVNFDDPLMNATVRALGGWERCCATPVEQFDVWLRKDFERIYQGFLRTGAEPALCLPLGGSCDRQNSALGFVGHIRPPVPVRTGLPPHRPSLVAIPAGSAGPERPQETALLEGIGTGPEAGK